MLKKQHTWQKNFPAIPVVLQWQLKNSAQILTSPLVAESIVFLELYLAVGILMAYYPEFGRLFTIHLNKLDKPKNWIAEQLGVNLATIYRWRGRISSKGCLYCSSYCGCT